MIDLIQVLIGDVAISLLISTCMTHWIGALHRASDLLRLGRPVVQVIGRAVLAGRNRMNRWRYFGWSVEFVAIALLGISESGQHRQYGGYAQQAGNQQSPGAVKTMFCFATDYRRCNLALPA